MNDELMTANLTVANLTEEIKGEFDIGLIMSFLKRDIEEALESAKIIAKNQKNDGSIQVGDGTGRII